MTLAKIAKRTDTQRAPKPKRRAALNALTHGITALSVPAAERPAFDLHRSAVVRDLAPEGFVEERLADRIALTIWRLQRVAMFEAGNVERAQDQARRFALHQGRFPGPVSTANADAARASAPAHSLDLRAVAAEVARLVEDDPEPYIAEPSSLERYALDLIDDARSIVALGPAPSGAELARLRTDALGYLWRAIVDNLRDHGVPPSRIANGVYRGRTASAQEVAALANQDDDLPPGVVARLWQFAERSARRRASQLAPVEVADGLARRWFAVAERLLALAHRAADLLSQTEAQAMMLADSTLEKIQRYEAHLERILYRALHELEAMQERRRGRPTPLARLEVHGLATD